VRALAFCLLLAAGAAQADDADEAALALADQTSTVAQQVGDWHIRAETALSESQARAGDTTHAQRLSLDLGYDKRLTPEWRLIFADRLDLGWRGRPRYDNAVNTLKEAYLSWQPQADRIADLGRINARYGVATGYNPTDYFRDGAARSIVSISPDSLRENRLGSVMLRGQQLWSSGSASVLYSPKLAERSNASPFSPDVGATNNQDRWLIALSQKLADGFSPQWLLYDDARGTPQLGLNLTALPNDATVAFLEWSGGRSNNLLAQAAGTAGGRVFRSRLATGLTYTTPGKLSVTLEYDYNGAGLAAAEWNALRAGAPENYLQYRSFVQNRQELPTRHNVFLYGRWQDALISKLDVNAMSRADAVDHSHLAWIEARYHWNQFDFSLQWQRNSGNSGTQYGALPVRQSWQGMVTYFF
jgi:hypothetical protein